MFIIGAMLFLIVLLLIPAGVVGAVYFVVTKKYWRALGVLAIALVAFQIMPESHFYPYPLIDTVRSEKFTEQKFELIQSGMSKTEVINLIGEQRGDYPSVSADGLERCERVTGDGALKVWDFAWLNANVCYDKNDRVTSANKFWQQD